MSDKNNYYRKYLKYKQKYLELKGGEILNINTRNYGNKVPIDKFDLTNCYNSIENKNVLICDIESKKKCAIAIFGDPRTYRKCYQSLFYNIIENNPNYEIDIVF